MGEVRQARNKNKVPQGVGEAAAIDMGVLPNLMGFMMRQAQSMIYQDFHQSMSDPNIRPPQFSILEVVNRNPGIRPSDVSAALGISRANLVPLLAELETLAWVQRKGDKTDGRAQVLHLTKSGAVQLEKLHKIVLPHEDRLAERLGPVGRDILLKLLRTLVAES